MNSQNYAQNPDHPRQIKSDSCHNMAQKLRHQPLPHVANFMLGASRAFFTPLGQARATSPVVAALSTELKRKNKLSANTPGQRWLSKAKKPEKGSAWLYLKASFE